MTRSLRRGSTAAYRDSITEGKPGDDPVRNPGGRAGFTGCSISSIVAVGLILAVPGRICGQLRTPEVEAHMVNLTFTARNADGELVKGLDRDDFTVYEDGVPRKLSLFSWEADLPLTSNRVASADRIFNR